MILTGTEKCGRGRLCELICSLLLLLLLQIVVVCHVWNAMQDYWTLMEKPYLVIKAAIGDF